MCRKAKMIIAVIMVVMASVFLTGISLGQEIVLSVTEWGSKNYFMLGGSIIDINELNSRLESKGYSKVPDSFVTLGAGSHITINDSVMIGGEYQRFIGREVTSGNNKISMDASYGFFDLGYIIYSMGDLKVYPLLGLGGGGVGLKVTEKGSPTFNEILDDPKRGVELSSSSFLLNLAFGTDYLMKVAGDEKGGGGFLFGLRLGYIYSPTKGGWKMGGMDIYDGPEISITGPYISLVIGGGIVRSGD